MFFNIPEWVGYKSLFRFFCSNANGNSFTKMKNSEILGISFAHLDSLYEFSAMVDSSGIRATSTAAVSDTSGCTLHAETI